MFFLKKLSFILAVLLCIPFSVTVNALSESEITAPSAVLMDSKTGKILYEKNSHEVRPCASITKVMTLTLVMEALDSGKISLSDTVTTSQHASSMGGSDIWLEVGETMSVNDMIKATVVASANDAAVALAEHLCGTEDAFVAQMNQKAKSLGMKETVFKNCNGLDEDGHVTSAHDVAVMSRELTKHKKIYDYSNIWMDNLRGGKTQLVNTNKLLKTYRGITGLKTGTTSKAGSCISATAERDGLSLIAVVLGSKTGKDRFSDAAKLLDYGFANYEMYTPAIPEGALTEIPVKNGMTDKITTSAKSGNSILIKKGDKEKITSEIVLPNEIDAPIEKNATVGKIIYKNSGHQIAEYPITAAETAEQINFTQIFQIIFKQVSGVCLPHC